MLYPSMNDLLKKIPNRYMLVNVVAKRAREIAEDAEKDGILMSEKPVKTALSEIEKGEIKIKKM